MALATVACFLNTGCATPPAIKPGEIWLDNRGQHVQAHGGGIIKVGQTYYWFGEDRTRGLDPTRRYVACYSSTDLAHWTFRNQVLKLANPENFGRDWVLERPKVFYNAKTRKFVMYMHIDGSLPGQRGGYNLARVGLAICDTVARTIFSVELPVSVLTALVGGPSFIALLRSRRRSLWL